MKIFTLGKGFISNHLKYPVISDYVDFNLKSIENIINNYKPDVLINCLGKTGRPNIDWCQSNKEITALTNTTLPILLAEACAKKSIRLINIGSGCIYFGESPNTIYDSNERIMIDVGWKENDFANPKSFYSKTKYACDLAIGELPYVTTLRIKMPISRLDHPRNLINKLKNYQQIINIPNSVTFMDDLVKCIDWVIENEKTDIFHVTNPEPLTAVQIMLEYKKYFTEHNFQVINEDQLDNLIIAKRSNCILNSDKLKKCGFEMTSSYKSLSECMAEYIKNV